VASDVEQSIPKPAATHAVKSFQCVPSQRKQAGGRTKESIENLLEVD
jgi:hypothetical protein